MALIDVHERELERFRHSMNLIGPGPAQFHFQDCIEGLKGFELAGEWADLGSGAGFPGLVLAHLFPHLRIQLVESRQKRATFLRHVLMAAGVEHPKVEVTQGRVEEMPDGLLDGVISRAFASPSIVLRHAARLLKPGEGYLILFLQEAPADLGRMMERWVVSGQNQYIVDGRRRRTLLLRWEP